MNMHVQEISIGSEKAVVIPKKAWRKIVLSIEDLEDIIAYDNAKKADDGVRVSLDDLKKELFHAPRPKATREKRNRT